MATKSAPFSMRLSKRMEALVDQEATRTGRSKGAIVEALAEEALRMRLFPGIAFRGVDWERRAWVIGTALDVWQIVDAHRDIGSIEGWPRAGLPMSVRSGLPSTTTSCLERRSTRP